MGSIQKIDRPKPWRARYRGPDGRQHSKSFRRKVDAERWWLLTEENAALAGSWVDPQAGSRIVPGLTWVRQPVGSQFQDTIGQQLHSRRGCELAVRDHAILDRNAQLRGFHQCGAFGRVTSDGPKP